MRDWGRIGRWWLHKAATEAPLHMPKGSLALNLSATVDQTIMNGLVACYLAAWSSPR
jgi:hypothetical protein